RQPGDAARDFWQPKLERLQEPTLLATHVTGASAGDTQGVEHQFWLDAGTTRHFQDFAGSQNLTLSTLFQGAWTLLLHLHTRQPQPCFGVTVSGRPAELPNAEEILGLFINTIPATGAVEPQRRVGDWLRGLQGGLIEAQAWAHAPLFELQRWAGR